MILPSEIQRLIFSFLIQPKTLLKDIRNFSRRLIFLEQVYNDYYWNDVYSGLYYLRGDLFYICNDSERVKYGRQINLKMANILKRGRRSAEGVVFKNHFLNFHPYEFQIRLMLGLMLPIERDEFCEMVKKMFC
jgi:hypothetical protein